MSNLLQIPFCQYGLVWNPPSVLSPEKYLLKAAASRPLLCEEHSVASALPVNTLEWLSSFRRRSRSRPDAWRFSILEVHPPHHPARSWEDFFIHIATIVVGLLIAVGLEQTVEGIHHRNERAELTEQMRAEAEHNVPVIQEDIDRLVAEYRYVDALRAALVGGEVTAQGVNVHGVPPPGVMTQITTPSRGTWQAYQAAGVTALLPTDQAKLYARVDFNVGEEQNAEDPMFTKLSELASECERTGYDHSSSAVSHITLSERKDLIYKLDQLNNSILMLASYLAIVNGADQAIVGGAATLDQMYPYQEKALVNLGRTDLRPGSSANFYGGMVHPDSSPFLYKGSKQPK
jgi:hypothetical protein